MVDLRSNTIRFHDVDKDYRVPIRMIGSQKVRKMAGDSPFHTSPFGARGHHEVSSERFAAVKLDTMSTQDYLAKHGVELRLAEAMAALIKERPDNPFDFLGTHLLGVAKEYCSGEAKLPNVHKTLKEVATIPYPPSTKRKPNIRAASETPQVLRATSASSKLRQKLALPGSVEGLALAQKHRPAPLHLQQLPPISVSPPATPQAGETLFRRQDRHLGSATVHQHRQKAQPCKEPFQEYYSKNFQGLGGALSSVYAAFPQAKPLPTPSAVPAEQSTVSPSPTTSSSSSMSALRAATFSLMRQAMDSGSLRNVLKEVKEEQKQQSSSKEQLRSQDRID